MSFFLSNPAHKQRTQSVDMRRRRRRRRRRGDFLSNRLLEERERGRERESCVQPRKLAWGRVATRDDNRFLHMKTSCTRQEGASFPCSEGVVCCVREGGKTFGNFLPFLKQNTRVCCCCCCCCCSRRHSGPKMAAMLKREMLVSMVHAHKMQSSPFSPNVVISSRHRIRLPADPNSTSLSLSKEKRKPCSSSSLSVQQRQKTTSTTPT